MKKVLFVATVTNHINAFHIPYLRMFKENGYEVHVASKGNEKIEYCDKHYEILFERNPIRLNNVNAYKKLKKIIDENNYEIIHCHTPVGGALTRLAARKARKKGTRVIYTAHGFHFYKGAPLANWLIFYPIEKYLAQYTDTIVTINNEDYELAKNKFSKVCNDIQYVPGVGVDVDRFENRLNKDLVKGFKQSLKLKQDDYILTCVARLDKNKNQQFLMNIMETIVKKNNKFHLLLVGPDELNGYYQNIVNNKKLNHNIHFLGRREDVPMMLSITDIVVSASLREGLPVNVIEALAAGKPVVALKCRGMDDLIINNKNGFICDNFDDFINSIFLIYNNKINNLDLRKTNNKILKKININSISNKFKKIYKL